MSEGEVERDPAAERVADEGHARDFEVVEESANVLDVGERPARKRGVAEAAQVEADDEVALSERVELAVPEPPVADAGVEEDDGRPVSGHVKRDLRAVERCRGQG